MAEDRLASDNHRNLVRLIEIDIGAGLDEISRQLGGSVRRGAGEDDAAFRARLLKRAVGRRTMEPDRVLACTLLWLRNHYDMVADDDRSMRMAVMAVVDNTLENQTPTVAEMAEWRASWSIE